jgi:molybdate transport system substrate-binding protein
MRRPLIAIVLLAAAAPLAACGRSSRHDATAVPGQPPSGSITVLAASDLRGAFDQIAAAFAKTCDCTVTFSYGSSGNIATQIKEGSPGDVFASADVSYIDGLEKDGLILPDTKLDYAIGRIVLATSVRSSLTINGLADLAGPEFKHVSIANPDHAPYGRAAKEALTALGLWDTIEPKLVLGENASQAAQYVETGDADAGIIPLSLAIQNRDKIRYVLIDDKLHRPLRQAAAVLKQSKHADVARAFLDYLNGPEGRPIMREYGFVLPGEQAQ